MKKLISFLLIIAMITCLFLGCAEEIPGDGLTEETTLPPVSVIQKVALISNWDSIDTRVRTVSSNIDTLPTVSDHTVIEELG